MTKLFGRKSHQSSDVVPAGPQSGPELAPVDPENLVDLIKQGRFSEIPEVQSMVSKERYQHAVANIPGSRHISLATQRRKISELPLDREFMRALENSGFPDRLTNATMALGAWLAEAETTDRSDPTARRNLIHQFLRPYSLPRPLDQQSIYHDLVSAATGIEDFIRVFNTSSTNLSDQLVEHYRYQEEASQYELASVIARSRNAGDAPTKWFVNLISNPAQPKEHYWPTILSNGLAAGTYDQFIAQNILKLYADTINAAEVPDIAIADTVDLITATIGRSLTEEEYAQLAANSKRWPPEARARIEAIRQDTAMSLGLAVSSAKADIAATLGIRNGGTNVEDAAKKAMSDLVTSADGIRARRVIKRGSGEIMFRVVQTQRDKPAGLPVPKAQTPDQPIQAAESIREPSTILTIDSNGNISDSPDTLAKAISEVTDTKRGDKFFDDAMQATIEELKTMDFSQAETHGVKKLAAKVVLDINGVSKELPIHTYSARLNPQSRVKTREALMYRVYFIHIADGVIGLLGIERRDKQDQFLKRRADRY